MGNFIINIPELGSKFVDLRGKLAGDSFNWHWIRPMSQVRYLAIHHSAGPDTQTPADIANYHVNSQGWGGIGYHFVISKDGIVYYVGDLTTARANVYSYNHLVIGICLIGSFMTTSNMSGKVPPDAQIQATHLLCSKLLFKTPELSGADGWEDVIGHKQLGATACPGDSWDQWRGKIVSGTGVISGDNKRIAEITELYRLVLGRDPDQPGLTGYVNSTLTIDQIRKEMVASVEHQQILNKAKALKQVGNLASEAAISVGQAAERIHSLSNLLQSS